MTARAPARDRDAERARARRPESCSTSVSSRPSRRPAADRRAGRASWLRTTACGARRQAMSEVLRRGGRDECDVCVSRPLPPHRMGRAVVARVELRLVPFGCHGHVHGPALTFRVSQRRPEPHVFRAARPVAIPAHPSLSEVNSGHRGERTAALVRADRSRTSDVPLKWSQSTTSARFAASAMSAATSISWRASSPIIRGPRRPPDGPKWRCIRGSIDWPPNGRSATLVCGVSGKIRAQWRSRRH